MRQKAGFVPTTSSLGPEHAGITNTRVGPSAVADLNIQLHYEPAGPDSG